jgi:capsid assembly protease
MFHAQIAQRAFNTPLLVEPSKAMAFLSGLGPRITGRQLRLAGIEVAPEDMAYAALPARAGILTNGLAERYQHDGHRPFAMVDGVAVIEVSGALVHRGAWIGQSSGQTSYEGIAAQLGAAASDPAVRGVALEIDSFGGEVAGVFDLADAIRTARTAKPVWAFVAEHAFSAGYALASQADWIILPRTGAVGSIGVVVMHADLSGQLSDAGVTVTLIHSGVHKVDGNPYAPLPDPVRVRIQAEIDSIRSLFAQTVAAGRGRSLTAEAALATEAECYRGTEAVAAGLADEVSDPASAFAAFVAAVNGRGTLRNAGPARPAKSHLSKESIMKPNATTTTVIGTA